MSPRSGCGTCTHSAWVRPCHGAVGTSGGLEPQALYLCRGTHDPAMTLENDPVPPLYRLTVSCLGQFVTKRTPWLEASFLVEHTPSSPTSRSNTQHRLKLRMLDAVPCDSRRDARVVRLMLPRQRQRVASRRRGLSQVPRGTPVALAPGPLWPACHPTPWMVSSPLSGGAADVATSVMTSSGTSAQSGSGHTVPPEFAGGPVQAAHHGPLALPSLTRNNSR